MQVWTPNFLAMRLAAMTMPLPCRPPPTARGRPAHSGCKAISQLAKKLSPSTCRIRLGALVAGIPCRQFRTRCPVLSNAQLQIGERIFQRQEMPLPVQAAGKTAQGAIFSDHAVTRDDDGHRVPACACPGCTDGLGSARPPGQFAVVDGFAMRDARDLLPDLLLEF